MLGPRRIATSDLRQHNKHLVGTMLCVVQCAGTVVWMVRSSETKAFVSIILITVKMVP